MNPAASGSAANGGHWQPPPVPDAGAAGREARRGGEAGRVGRGRHDGEIDRAKHTGFTTDANNTSRKMTFSTGS